MAAFAAKLFFYHGILAITEAGRRRTRSPERGARDEEEEEEEGRRRRRRRRRGRRDVGPGLFFRTSGT
jgi:hypothetical protein